MVWKSIEGLAILALGARIPPPTPPPSCAAQRLGEEGIKWELLAALKVVRGSPHLSASLGTALSQGSCLAQGPSPGNSHPVRPAGKGNKGLTPCLNLG